jgi:hypothetical protein
VSFPKAEQFEMPMHLLELEYDPTIGVEETVLRYYQRGPKDLFRPEFRRRRARPSEERLRHIESTPSWPEEMLRLYDRKEGTASDLVHWRFLPRELVERSVHLILFAPSRRRKAPPYELIEVKGPGDQLQINQRRWLRYFSSHGIPYRLIRVQWRK